MLNKKIFWHSLGVPLPGNSPKWTPHKLIFCEWPSHHWPRVVNEPFISGRNPKNDCKPKPGGRYMLFVLYQILVIRKIAKNCWRQKFYDYRTLTISNFILFVLRLFVIWSYLLFVISYFKLKLYDSEYLITTSFFGKYFEFYKPFVNFIFIGLDTIF